MSLDIGSFFGSSNSIKYYLPHHAVINSSSSTTKLRVVSDDYSGTERNLSLNSILSVGLELQLYKRDLCQILLSFRFPKVVFKADVAKMYRQVLIDSEDQNFQRIVWIYNPSDEIASTN
ncbi:hypothetical protein AVEN_147980-1 [Araneus ventricosus]|uniref:Reverse transcriptase domain-containing protein n=1 Tax=Araneus ventricosus TaxID=182803 RepID=A0A4Y2H734_ARAVE|nr:hypothetical protein AVEN_147980-1 [Araneus ventricosus]